MGVQFKDYVGTQKKNLKFVHSFPIVGLLNELFEDTVCLDFKIFCTRIVSF